MSTVLDVNAKNTKRICQSCGGQTTNEDCHYCNKCFDIADYRMKNEPSGDPFR